jgi:crossover junction endodeoxyribonuclease RuvC
MKILGIDASSTCTGWALVEASDVDTITVIEYGEIELSKFKKKSFPLEYVNILFLAMQDLCKRHKPDKVYIEDIYFARSMVTAYKALARMRGVCEAAILSTGLKSLKPLTTMQLRESVLGTGKFEKAQVCTILEKRHDITLATTGFDQSDALLVALGGVIDTYAKIASRVRKRKSRTSVKSYGSSKKTRRKRVK